MEWTKVEDKLPDDLVTVLFVAEGWPDIMMGFWTGTKDNPQWTSEDSDNMMIRQSVTHWMPLPPMPGDE